MIYSSYNSDDSYISSRIININNSVTLNSFDKISHFNKDKTLKKINKKNKFLKNEKEFDSQKIYDLQKSEIINESKEEKLFIKKVKINILNKEQLFIDYSEDDTILSIKNKIKDIKGYPNEL